MISESRILAKALYAFTQSIEVTDESAILVFDAVAMSDVQRLSNVSDKFGLLKEVETYYLVALMSGTQYSMMHNEPWFPVEGEWRRLTFEDQAPMPLAVFNAYTEDNLGSAEANLHILEQSDLEMIDEVITFPSESSQADVKALFAPWRGTRSSDTFTATYDVGQGLCCAVCETTCSSPLVYFDFGCGCYRNAHTRPTNMRFCFTQQPPIVLTHWHHDHYMAAHLLDKNALNAQWLVPSQKTGLTPVKLAAVLHGSGRLHVWPNSLPAVSTPWGMILKCTGNSMNSSGIACVVRNRGVRCGTLLPGDADYSSIPGITGMSFAALVVSHHGGSTLGAVPSPQRCRSPYVLSYGNGNLYGHPRAQSLQALANAGWKRRLDTVNGHVGLLSARQHLPRLGCRGTQCDLQIVQR